MQSLREHLARHDYRHLFIEELGWDSLSGELSVDSAEGAILLRRVAHKRGVQVFACSLSSTQLTDRRLLRVIEAQVVQQSAEHIVIYYSEQLGQQCWQWAAVGPSGSRLRHREHPFTSRLPPDKVVSRIHALAVAFDAEDSTSLTDITARLRDSFDNDAEFSSFFRGASWRVLSEALHRKWQETRSDVDLNAFLSIHLNLLPWAVKRFAPRRLDPDDAAQVAFLGLRRSALGFDPNYGSQFSTYAATALKQWITRFAPDHTEAIKCRSNRLRVFRHCERRANRLSVQAGGWRGARLLELLAVRLTTVPAHVFLGIRNIESLDDPAKPCWRIQRGRIDPTHGPLEQMIHEEELARLPAVLGSLAPRETAMIRKRFGLDGSEQESTLDEIAAVHGLTKERVRQILMISLERLRYQFEKLSESEAAARDAAMPPRCRRQDTASPVAVGSYSEPSHDPPSVLAQKIDRVAEPFSLRSVNASSPRLFEDGDHEPELISPLPDSALVVTSSEASDDAGTSQNESALSSPDMVQPATDLYVVERAVRAAGAKEGMLVSDLIVKLRMPGARVRAALHVLARLGEVERAPDLRWRIPVATPREEGNLQTPIAPTTAQAANAEQPSLFGTTP